MARTQQAMPSRLGGRNAITQQAWPWVCWVAQVPDPAGQDPSGIAYFGWVAVVPSLSRQSLGYEL